MLTAAPFDRHMPINRGMTYEQMLDAVETQPVHVIEATLDDDTSGLYCEAVQTIIIDEHMTDVQKRCSLTHELFHWLHADDSHAEYGKSHAEWRVRRETAMFLIDPGTMCRPNGNMMARSIRCPVRWMSRYSFWRTTVGFWNTANRYTTEERRHKPWGILTRFSRS